MTRSVFVDTSAWFALLVPWDANHAAAQDWFTQRERSLLTTDYVLDETLTLLKSRHELSRAVALGSALLGGAMGTLYLLDAADLQRAWEVFLRFRDKDWSFTDCTSKVLIEKFQIGTAFAFDHHFLQFGTVVVEP